MNKNWLVGFLGALGCIVVGDAAGIYCQIYGIEGLVSIVSWLVPLAGFVYFFFFKFWRKGEEIDAYFVGRVRRWTYFGETLLWSFIVTFFVAASLAALATTVELDQQQKNMLLPLGQMLVGPLVMLAMFRYNVRRLHDMDWTCKVAKWQALIAMLSLSGFMMPSLAAFVIVIGYVPNFILGLIVLFHGGTAGENKYGANPRVK